MRKAITLLTVCSLVVIAAGCASTYPVGTLYTELKMPVSATANTGNWSKKGTAECVSYLSLFTQGDASIETAKKNGGITKVHHVDWEVKNVLGIIGNYKVIVYGE